MCIFFFLFAPHKPIHKECNIFSKVHLYEWMTNPLAASGAPIRKDPVEFSHRGLFVNRTLPLLMLQLASPTYPHD